LFVLIKQRNYDRSIESRSSLDAAAESASDGPYLSLKEMENCMSTDNPTTWYETVVKVLKDNDVRLIAYVPDNVLSPLIKLLHADPCFTVVCPAREEEAIGIVSGAYMGGVRGIVLMQTSGFATVPNALASLACPFQIPLVMMISERGTLGDFQLGQAIVCRTMRPVLETLGIEHFAIERLDDVEFVVDRMIKQAFWTQAPAAMILSALLTKKNNVKQ
jgi:sulfopyruvate decarboxylase alpha subunit